MRGALPQRSPYTSVTYIARESMKSEVAGFLTLFYGTMNNLRISHLSTIVTFTTVSMDCFVFYYCAKSNMHSVLNKNFLECKLFSHNVGK
jgi:hypothetical protein